MDAVLPIDLAEMMTGGGRLDFSQHSHTSMSPLLPVLEMKKILSSYVRPSSVCGCMWVNGRPVSNRSRAWTFLNVISGPGIRSSPLDSPLSVRLDIDIVRGTEIYTVFQKQIIFCDVQIHRAGSGRVQKYKYVS